MSWIQTAKVGQRVVCIRDVGLLNKEHVKRLIEIGGDVIVKYDIYTIREIRSDDSEVVFLLKELKNPVVYTLKGYLEQAFSANYFKPLDESRLDIFRAMLVEKPQHADA